MNDTRSWLDVPFPSSLVRLDLPDDRGLSIVVDGEGGAFEIAWDVILSFAAAGDPFLSGYKPSNTITEIGAISSFLDYIRATHGDFADPDYVAAMGLTVSAEGRPLRHWRIVSHDWGFDVAAVDSPKVRSIKI